MRRRFSLVMGTALLTASAVPGRAASAAPDPAECAAAAEIMLHDWHGRAAKARTAEDAEVARQQIARAEAVRRVTGNPATPPTLQRKYADLGADLRDVFVVRCAIKLGAL